jgi:putative DNA methylase
MTATTNASLGITEAQPMLLTRVDWAAVEELVRIQQRNREVHTPPISLFRWWARRPHALVGALLDAAQEIASEPLTVSDPFSGGGTVAVEAARRGFDVYAQDLHPWAINGLRSVLEEVAVDELEEAAAAVLSAVKGERERFYGRCCSVHGRSEVLTALWVRRVSCPSCSADVFLYPYSYVTRASRAANETHGWWGCASCGAVTRSSLKARERRCTCCRRRLGDSSHALLENRRARCPDRQCRHEFEPLLLTPNWQIVLVQRRCHDEAGPFVHFDRPSGSEMEQATRSVGKSPASLCAAIPVGLETTVLRRAGFKSWADLYVPRQLESLLAVSEAINALPHSTQIKNRLRLALCGASEMAGRVSRWDRHYPKAYEATANHRFAVTGLSAEVNLLADRGRGVLKRRFTASARAARWRSEEIPTSVSLRRRRNDGRRIEVDGTLLAIGSSVRQLVSRGSVDLVLTDPPYFDDVQYAELAGLFLAWSRTVGLIANSVELDLAAEAVANTRRGTGVEEYRELLTAILGETRRSLTEDGRVILTYHNTDLRAWWALGRALRDAGLGIYGIAAVHAENDADHSKRGRRSFMRDLVIEARAGNGLREPVQAGSAVTDGESGELLSAGRALAAMPAGESLQAFRARYRALRGVVAQPRISPTAQELRSA